VRNLLIYASDLPDSAPHRRELSTDSLRAGLGARRASTLWRMDAIDDIARAGGIAHISTLRHVNRRELDALVAAKLLARPRRGWYAMPNAPHDFVRAVSVGGQVSCISALRVRGVWCVDDHRLHVSVPSNATRVKGADLLVHYNARPGANHSVVADDTVHALAHAFSCQSRENVIVALNSALNLRRIRESQLPEIQALVARKYWPYFGAVDGTCESGLETKCVLRLRRLNLRVRTQVLIPRVGRVDVVVGDRLVVELDGIGFHTGDAVKRDRRRDLELHRLGYLVLRVDYGMVMDEWDNVEEVIRLYVSRREHRWSPRHMRAGLGAIQEEPLHLSRTGQSYR
jgi:very-short-patch-repair endonuclease